MWRVGPGPVHSMSGPGPGPLGPVRVCRVQDRPLDSLNKEAGGRVIERRYYATG